MHPTAEPPAGRFDDSGSRTVGRHYDINDMKADVLGVLVSLVVYELLSAWVRAAGRKGNDHLPGEPREASKS